MLSDRYFEFGAKNSTRRRRIASWQLNLRERNGGLFMRPYWPRVHGMRATFGRRKERIAESMRLGKARGFDHRLVRQERGAFHGEYERDCNRAQVYNLKLTLTGLNARLGCGGRAHHSGLEVQTCSQTGFRTGRHHVNYDDYLSNS